MSPTWIAALAFVGTTLAVCGLAALVNSLFLHYQGRLDERLEGLNSVKDNLDDGSVFKRYGVLGDDRSPAACWARIEACYQRAHLKFPFMTYLQASGAAAAVLGAVTGAVARRWWPVPIVFALVLLGSAWLIFVRRRRRSRALTAQLPKALDVIRRAVRAGQTVPAAFQIVADDFDAPISEEFRSCYEEQHFGISHETALRNLAERTGLMELQILVVALLVHSRSGGNLVELLDNLAQTVQRRLRLEDRTRALTGEGRMQAAVLIALPTVAFLLLMMIAPTYMAALLAYPSLLVLSVAAQVLGAVWIRRCINFEY